MNIEEVKQFCRSLPLALEVDHGHPANILTYSIYGKRFAYFKTSEPEQWRFSFRTTSEYFLELTDQPGIKPARFMHRFHWVTVVDVNTMQDNHLRSFIDWSYYKAVQSLPKSLRKSLAEANHPTAEPC